MTRQNSAAAWFEIPATDLERATGFYETLLEIKLRRENVGPMTLAIFPHDKPGTGGAVLKADGYEPASQGTVVYLNLTDVRPALARLEKAGGKLLQPLTKLPDGAGVFALLRDTEGNRVGVFSPA